MKAKRIRCGKGLGDSLYLQSVVRHLVNKGENLEVCTNWDDVFIPLKDKVKLAPFSREGIDIVAHYSMRKSYISKQFDDCCIQAGIEDDVEFKLDWTIQNKKFIRQFSRIGKPIALVLIYRLPMDRADGFAQELLPDINVIQKVINGLKDSHTIILCGSGQAIKDYEGIDIDVSNKTTVSELIDLALISDVMIGYCSFFVPLAESLNKKALFVWADKGLKSSNHYIKTITPHKILYKDSSKFVIDSWSEEKIDNVINQVL